MYELRAKLRRAIRVFKQKILPFLAGLTTILEFFNAVRPLLKWLILIMLTGACF